MPYLNSAPFFRGLPLGDRYELFDAVPREQAVQAAAGGIEAGLLPVAEYFRLQERFGRLGPFGIAVRGRAHSAILFSRKPIRQLDGASIAVTDQSSTSVCLLRLLLEIRYHLHPARYNRSRAPEATEADALMLIGDDALTYRHANAQYPFEIDLAFEWWLWQHLPFVFAVWVVRKDVGADTRKSVEIAIIKALAANMPKLDVIGQEHAGRLGLSANALSTYLSAFIYRLSQPEEAGIARFRELLDEHHLL